MKKSSYKWSVLSLFLAISAFSNEKDQNGDVLFIDAYADHATRSVRIDFKITTTDVRTLYVNRNSNGSHNQLLSILLTAKTTGKQVHIWWEGTNGVINRIRLLKNAEVYN